MAEQVSITLTPTTIDSVVSVKWWKSSAHHHPASCRHLRRPLHLVHVLIANERSQLDLSTAQ
jgi:hypothetical protein